METGCEQKQVWKLSLEKSLPQKHSLEEPLSEWKNLDALNVAGKIGKEKIQKAQQLSSM